MGGSDEQDKRDDPGAQNDPLSASGEHPEPVKNLSHGSVLVRGAQARRRDNPFPYGVSHPAFLQRVRK
jgi:hypothetical protein